jgi:hypothetical protein
MMNIHAQPFASATMQPLSALPEADYAIVTPYLLPPGSPKTVNVGDGFILDSAIRLIGERPRALISSRAPLGPAEIEWINDTRCLIAAGANTLKDAFELTPGFDLATMKRIKVPVVLMGVGHYGRAEATRGLTPASAALFRAMLERFPLISVRCDASRDYVVRSLPDKADSILMTSCPVAHRVDGIDRGFARKPHYEQLVVTVTDGPDLQSQLPLLPAARQLFPAKRRILALHQDHRNARLWKFAEDQGFEVFRGGTYEQFIALYAASDIHFGNRVHAHLKCLSLGVPSFLTRHDLRQSYFADSLDFPLVVPMPSPEFANYDFGRVVARRNVARATMDAFVAALRAVF